ncbi:hypothetical protein OEZ85_009347 [Tetradesmus obliquus]|uniref:Uncharacterized protein n=1 Tax=Tetradesmus obliquus TaxID=3088 RepID=A0ABY8UBL5_TETOB|nr:hypothetical protein OEZ85_009347 [Tetradesmus obliquus]
MAKMAFFALGLVLAGSLQRASAARQLQQVLPALAGNPTWAPAASYNSMHITAPLPVTAPMLGPNGIAMPNLTPPLGVYTSASNMRMAGAPAPIISLPPGFTAAAAAAAAPKRALPESELERPRFVDNTKMVVADSGSKLAGTGVSAPAGATNTVPKSTTPFVQTAPGSGATPAINRDDNAPFSQALPAIPNLPVKPPTLIFDGKFPMPAQPYQWPTAQQPQQQQQPAMQMLGQTTQKAAQLVQQQLANPAEQLQRLAAAASEGNLARFIEDAGKAVSKNIQNVTAAANSFLAATNNILESIPKNLTVPGELGKLINATTLQLPKLPSLNPTQVSSMARLPGSGQLPSLSSLFSGLQSLQLPGLPGFGGAMNPAAAAGAATAQNAASVAAAGVNVPTYYAQDWFGAAALNANPGVAAAAAAPPAPMSELERKARAAAQKAQDAVTTAPAQPAQTVAAAAPAHDASQQAAAAARRAARAAAQQQQQARAARASAALQSGSEFKVIDGQVVPAAQ